MFVEKGGSRCLFDNDLQMFLFCFSRHDFWEISLFEAFFARDF
jgi:hypothetical protein